MHLSQHEFLRHILNECSYLQKESDFNSYSEFMENERLSRAVCRSLEIIGEARSKIHPDIKAKYPHIPWREMSDIRNKIIHHYFGIDYEIVWDTVKSDVPALREYISIILANSENN